MKTQASNISVPQRWDDIVFDGRNQSYGAYVIRSIHRRNLLLAVAAPKKLVYTELSAPPPIDKPKPPPPQIQLPKLQKVIKFVPPKVVKEEVVEEVPTIEEIKQNEVAAVEVEGDAEVVFEEPVQAV